jgi:sodium/bile acid cotransporter 7
MIDPYGIFAALQQAVPMKPLLSWLSVDPYIASIVGMVVLASLLPAQGTAMVAASGVGAAMIAVMFFLQGARLAPQTALAGARHWRLHAVVLASTFLLFPALGLTARAIAPGLLTPPLWAGVLMLCLLPSTVQSSIAFTSIARGNVPAAVCSATLSNVAGIFITPVLVGLTMGALAKGGHAGVDLHSIQSIALQLLLPFILGHLSRPLTTQFLTRHKTLVGRVDRSSILLVVYTAFSAAVVEGLWKKLSAGDIALVLVLDGALLAVALVITTLAARLLGFSKADEIAIVFCGSKKSLASGVPMAGVLFPAAVVGPLIVPLMLFHQIQLMVCAVMARRYAAGAEDGVAGEAVKA